MDTKLATTQIRIQQWTAIINDLYKSGLKMDDYCEQHGLSRNAYYYWLRKVKETALTQTGFVEIQSVITDTGTSSKKPQSKSTSFIPQMLIINKWDIPLHPPGQTHGPVYQGDWSDPPC